MLQASGQVSLLDAYLLDHHHHLLNTYVQLSPRGNELIAPAITDRLAQRLDCAGLATP